jgi:hypothetical protein
MESQKCASRAVRVDASHTQLTHDKQVTRRRRDPHRRNLSLGQIGLEDETDLRPPPHRYQLRFARSNFKVTEAAAHNRSAEIRHCRHHPYLLPIENASVRCPEHRCRRSLRQQSVHIPKQRIDTPAHEAFAKMLSRNPWYSLPEHRPLGDAQREPD